MNITFKDFHKWIEPNNEYFSFLAPLKEILSTSESYKDGCISFWKRDYSEEPSYIFYSNYRNDCYYFDMLKNNLISIAPQAFCELKGTLDKVGIAITNYQHIQSYIIIEGCYFYNKYKEKEDVIWTLTNSSVNMLDSVKNYLMNLTTKFQINNGEIFFGDGSNNCSRLCQKVSSDTKFLTYEDISSIRTDGNLVDFNVAKLAVFILIGLILVSILGYHVYKIDVFDKNLNDNY